MLGEDQTEALTRIAVSGRVVDILVGPAGYGRARAAPHMTAGLILEANGLISKDMSDALNERRDLIEACTDAVLDAANNSSEL